MLREAVIRSFRIRRRLEGASNPVKSPDPCLPEGRYQLSGPDFPTFSLSICYVPVPLPLRFTWRFSVAFWVCTHLHLE